MQEEKRKISAVLSAPPHIKSGDSIKTIMWTFGGVLMLPLFLSVYFFGLYSALIPAVSVISAVLSEAVFQLVRNKKIRITDGSAVITGLLLGLSLPPQIPLWIPAAGSIFAIVVMKELFGGLGSNMFNPALAGRTLLMIVFPSYMSNAWYRFPNGTLISEKLGTDCGLTYELYDAITQATPLAAFKNGSRMIIENNLPAEGVYEFFTKNSIIKSLVAGNTGGSLGETSALLLLICALILIWKRVITWHIPVFFIGTAALSFYIYYSYTGYAYTEFALMVQLLSGGLLFAAFFMATDMVTTPLTAGGLIIFGIGCGLITFVIRTFTGLPEGAGFAILIMNALVPVIDKFTKPVLSVKP